MHTYILFIGNRNQEQPAGVALLHTRATPQLRPAVHTAGPAGAVLSGSSLSRARLCCALCRRREELLQWRRELLLLPSPPEIPEHMLGHPAHPQRMIALMYSCALGSAPVIGQRRFNSAQHHGKAVLQVCGRCGGVRVRYVWPQGVAPILGSAG